MKHLHQLSLKKQIEILRKIQAHDVTATVKEDGVAFTVGVDSTGRRYVSREGKQALFERYFSIGDVAAEPKNSPLSVTVQLWCGRLGEFVNGYCAGDRWNVEYIGPELNVIDYDQPEIVLLFPLSNETTGQISTDITALDLPTDSFLVKRPYWFTSNDGELRSAQLEELGSIRITSSAEIPEFVGALELLDRHFDGGTIQDLLSINMNTVKKIDKASITAQRDYFSAWFKREVGNGMFHVSRRREGIVLNVDGELTKLVAPNFVETNQFFHAVRNCIKRRTFSKEYTKYFPTCPPALLESIDELWKSGKDHNMLIRRISELRAIYEHAQRFKLLAGPFNMKWYPDTVHTQTMVEFASFTKQLAQVPVNTRNG